MPAEKVVNLYRDEEVEAWEEARAAVENDPDLDPPREGAILKILADAYTGRPEGVFGAEEEGN